MTAEKNPQEIVLSKNLETLGHALDGLFRVPGTRFRFGIDALVGLIPGVGDAATSLASFTILVAAVRYRVPKIVILRMALNLAIDYVVGAIPLLGDAFDFVWKANTRNLQLLRARGRALHTDGTAPVSPSREAAAESPTADYVFVGVVLASLVGLLIGCAALAVWIAAQALGAL